MHGLGHGVGLTIGERPYLSLYGKERLRKNSVVTIEPGLYDPKVGGVRIEDIVVVGSPSENLTHLPKDLQIRSRKESHRWQTGRGCSPDPESKSSHPEESSTASRTASRSSFS